MSFYDVEKSLYYLFYYIDLTQSISPSGFLEPPAVAPSSRQSAEGTDDGDRGTGGTRPSKLRHSLKFTWNHSVASPSGSGVKPESQSDAAYEVS